MNCQIKSDLLHINENKPNDEILSNAVGNIFGVLGSWRVGSWLDKSNMDSLSKQVLTEVISKEAENRSKDLSRTKGEEK